MGHKPINFYIYISLFILFIFTTTVLSISTVTPYLPTDNGFFIHVLTTIECPLSKCNGITKYHFSSLSSTTSSYGYSTAFVSLRQNDGIVNFISSSKGASFPKDRTNILSLIDPTVSGSSYTFPTSQSSFTIQSTYYVLASSLSQISRLKTGTLSIIITLEDSTTITIDEQLIMETPLSTDASIYNNTIAVKHPLYTESFQFLVDTHHNATSTNLYTTLPTTINSPSLPTTIIPPISTVLTLISPTEFSFIHINIPDITYPTTHQVANCHLNNFPLNATISTDGSKLFFQPVLGDIVGRIMRYSPLISCRDIHIKNTQAVSDTVQYKFTSLILISNSTQQSLETRLINGEIVSTVATTYNSTIRAYPISFYSGILPQLALGTTFYQPYDVAKSITNGNTNDIPDGLTSGTSDVYIWDIEYPYPSSEMLLDPELFTQLKEHIYTSSAFQSFESTPTTTAKLYPSMTRNIIKVINPYILTNMPTLSLPTNTPHLYLSPTINITHTPTLTNPTIQSTFCPYTDIWHTSLEQYYSPHFTIAFTNLQQNKLNINSSIQTLNLTLPLTSLISSLQKNVIINYRANPNLFPKPLVPTITFSQPGDKLDFLISGTWFESRTTFSQAKISSRFGKTYFSGDFRTCTATLVSDHSIIPINITAPRESYELPEPDTFQLQSTTTSTIPTESTTTNNDNNNNDIKIQQTEDITFEQHFQSLQIDPSDVTNVKETNTFYIWFGQEISGDVRILCSYAYRQQRTPIPPPKPPTPTPPEEEQEEFNIQQNNNNNTNNEEINILQTPSSLQPATFAKQQLDLDIITIGTDHYGSIQDLAFISGSIYPLAWSPNYIPPTPIDPDPKPKPDPPKPEKKGLSAGIIVLIVLASICGTIVLAIGGYFATLWGIEQYNIYAAKQVEYQQQKDAFEATKVDVIEVTHVNNNDKKKKRRKN